MLSSHGGNRYGKGIENGESNYFYQDNLDFHMRAISEEFKEDTAEIIKFCLEINNSLKETNNRSNLETIFKLFETDFNKFIEKVRERDNDYRFAPFWLKFSFKKITQRIKTLDPEQIWGFGHYFNDRYRRNIFPELYPEKKFVIDLLTHIDRPTKNRKRKNLRNASLDYLSKCLNECEQNFPAT